MIEKMESENNSDFHAEELAVFSMSKNLLRNSYCGKYKEINEVYLNDRKIYMNLLGISSFFPVPDRDT